MNIAKTIKEKRYNATSGKMMYQILYSLYNAGRFVTNPYYRSRVISILKYKPAYHQLSNFTQSNRYPDLFSVAQAHFKNHAQPKLLSFGCSTGEEVASLKAYLPDSYCVGVDINDWCVAQAAQKYGQPDVLFFHSLSQDFEEMTDFDAIFCLAVFQHPKNRHEKNRTVSAYPFSRFEAQLQILDKKLKPGGLLFIDQYDFNFFETCLMSFYTLYPTPKNQILRDRPLFNKNNWKIASKQNSFRIFQKK